MLQSTLFASASGVGGVLSASISPSSGSTLSPFAGFSSDLFTAMATGGTGPYTYAWVKLSGDAIACNSPTSATTLFSVTTMPPGILRAATFRVTATDSVAATAICDLYIEMERS